MELANYYGGMSPVHQRMAYLRSLRGRSGGAARKQPASYYNCLKACRTDAYGYKATSRPEGKKLLEAKARAASMGMSYPQYQAFKKLEAKTKAKSKRQAFRALPKDERLNLMASRVSERAIQDALNELSGKVRKVRVKKAPAPRKPRRKTQNISMTTLLKGRARMLGLSPIGTNATLKQKIANREAELSSMGVIPEPSLSQSFNTPSFEDLYDTSFRF